MFSVLGSEVTSQKVGPRSRGAPSTVTRLDHMTCELRLRLRQKSRTRLFVRHCVSFANRLHGICVFRIRPGIVSRPYPSNSKDHECHCKQTNQHDSGNPRPNSLSSQAFCRPVSWRTDKRGSGKDKTLASWTKKLPPNLITLFRGAARIVIPENP